MHFSGQEQENWVKVPLLLSAKRIHPGTKQNNLLLEPLAEGQDKSDTEDKPEGKKYRRKRRLNSNLLHNVSQPQDGNFEESSFTQNDDTNILDNLTNAFDDNDDGFTTIKGDFFRQITISFVSDFTNFFFTFRSC